MTDRITYGRFVRFLQNELAAELPADLRERLQTDLEWALKQLDDALLREPLRALGVDPKTARILARAGWRRPAIGLH